MSMQAGLVRLGLRLLKNRNRRAPIAQIRRRLGAFERLTPGPPRGTVTKAIEAGGVTASSIATPASRSDRCLLFLHGGGYTTGAASNYRHFTWRLAAAARAQVLAIDYRLAPENPFPAALEDAVASYRWLLTDRPDGSRIAIVGDSAGGGLAFALFLKLRDEGLALPAAIVALSPWTDLALTGASLAQNARADAVVDPHRAVEFAQAYLAGADPRTPYASPLYGDWRNAPPALIQVGADEVLRDDSVRMAEKLRASGCDVELEIWPGMPHVWHLLAPVLPEARRAIARIGAFLDARL